MSEVILMTREEAARALRLSLRTIDTLILRHELNVRRIGRRVLIPVGEVERFAAVAPSGPDLAPAAA